jgi:hypothetical protein
MVGANSLDDPAIEQAMLRPRPARQAPNQPERSQSGATFARARAADAGRTDLDAGEHRL